jgi:rhodanese-related sulfurtransferase
VADETVEGYAGNLTPEETWEILKTEKDAVLVDVRSAAEWVYVGMVDLSSIGKEDAKIEWKSFSAGGMVENPNFAAEVDAVCTDKDVKVLSLCRSGVRSIATSKKLTEAGFTQAYNVLEGFEGDKDTAEHRATIGGWKFRGLAWKQK